MIPSIQISHALVLKFDHVVNKKRKIFFTESKLFQKSNLKEII